jgi:hypothetical protein
MVGNQRKSKGRKSEILSGLPCENTLQEKLRDKAADDEGEKAKCKKTNVRRNLVDRTVVSIPNIIELLSPYLIS